MHMPGISSSMMGERGNIGVGALRSLFQPILSLPSVLLPFRLIVLLIFLWLPLFPNGDSHRFVAAATNFTAQTLYQFVDDGTSLSSNLIQASDGQLYGTSQMGGLYGFGTIYQLRITPTIGYQVVYSFMNSAIDGGHPPCGLLQGSNGQLYGISMAPPSLPFSASIFSYSAEGFLILANFSTAQIDVGNGVGFQGLVQPPSNGHLYGVTTYSGAYGYGSLYRYILLPANLTIVYSFGGHADDGGYPYGSLAYLSSDSDYLYGVTQMGAEYGNGGVYRVSTLGDLNFTLISSFASSHIMGNIYHPIVNVYTLMDSIDAYVFVVATSQAAPFPTMVLQLWLNETSFPQNMTKVYSIGMDTNYSSGLLAVSDNIDSSYYGVSANAEESVLYRLSPAGTFGLVSNFTLPKGCAVSELSNIASTLYGTCSSGVIFGLSYTGEITVLHTPEEFYDTTLYSPAGVQQSADGSIYTLLQNGNILEVNSSTQQLAVLYTIEEPSISPSQLNPLLVVPDSGAVYATWANSIYRFTFYGDGLVGSSIYSSSASDTINPMMYSPDSEYVFATSTMGGSNATGRLFQISTAEKTLNTFNSMYSFASANQGGVNPVGNLIVGNDVFVIYGVTSGGGTNGMGIVYSFFNSNLSPLHYFGSTEGSPVSGLVQSSVDGALYGTTPTGSSGNGVIYRLNTDRSNYLNIYTFTGGSTDGGKPLSNLIEGPDLNLWGTTSTGGAHGYGTVFYFTTQGQITTVYSFGASTGVPAFPLLVGAVPTESTLVGITSSGKARIMFSINVPAAVFPPAPSSSSSVNVAAIAAPVAIGGTLLLVLIVWLSFRYCKNDGGSTSQSNTQLAGMEFGGAPQPPPGDPPTEENAAAAADTADADEKQPEPSHSLKPVVPPRTSRAHRASKASQDFSSMAPITPDETNKV